MELQQLKYFKAVADIGKIFEAAKSLFVSALYPTTVTTKKPSTVSVEGLCSRYLSSWGSDATAAGGRRKELNEWQRSKFREQMRTETFGRRNRGPPSKVVVHELNFCVQDGERGDCRLWREKGAE